MRFQAVASGIISLALLSSARVVTSGISLGALTDGNSYKSNTASKSAIDLGRRQPWGGWHVQEDWESSNPGPISEKSRHALLAAAMQWLASLDCGAESDVLTTPISNETFASSPTSLHIRLIFVNQRPGEPDTPVDCGLGPLWLSDSPRATQQDTAAADIPTWFRQRLGTDSNAFLVHPSGLVADATYTYAIAYEIFQTEAHSSGHSKFSNLVTLSDMGAVRALSNQLTIQSDSTNVRRPSNQPWSGWFIRSDPQNASPPGKLSNATQAALQDVALRWLQSVDMHNPMAISTTAIHLENPFPSSTEEIRIRLIYLNNRFPSSPPDQRVQSASARNDDPQWSKSERPVPATSHDISSWLRLQIGPADEGSYDSGLLTSLDYGYVIAYAVFRQSGPLLPQSAPAQCSRHVEGDDRNDQQNTCGSMAAPTEADALNAARTLWPLREEDGPHSEENFEKPHRALTYESGPPNPSHSQAAAQIVRRQAYGLSPDPSASRPPTAPPGGPPMEPAGGLLKEPSGGPPKSPSGGPPKAPSGGPPMEPAGGPPKEPSVGPPMAPSGGPPKGSSGRPPAGPSSQASLPSKRRFSGWGEEDMMYVNHGLQGFIDPGILSSEVRKGCFSVAFTWLHRLDLRGTGKVEYFDLRLLDMGPEFSGIVIRLAYYNPGWYDGSVPPNLKLAEPSISKSSNRFHEATNVAGWMYQRIVFDDDNFKPFGYVVNRHDEVEGGYALSDQFFIEYRITRHRPSQKKPVLKCGSEKGSESADPTCASMTKNFFSWLRQIKSRKQKAQ
ncbi:MAG: hypothetical protein M1837_003893 [Sclerophora amabilis]|nr:MAG: hypothetical protein M1837_003893 [Sclerophora amabilis]